MNIDKIDILDNNIELSIFPKTNKLIHNKKETNITNEKIEALLNIIRSWKPNYYSRKGFDGARVAIKIYYDGKVDTITMTRKLPNNYDVFNKFVRDLYGR